MFKGIEHDNKGLNVNGDKLNYMGFADYIVLILIKITISITKFLAKFVASCNSILEGNEIQQHLSNIWVAKFESVDTTKIVNLAEG